MPKLLATTASTVRVGCRIMFGQLLTLPSLIRSKKIRASRSIQKDMVLRAHIKCDCTPKSLILRTFFPQISMVNVWEKFEQEHSYSKGR